MSTDCVIFNRELYLKSFTLCFVGISLIPRLLSSAALEVGTIYIIFFWVPFLVLLPEYIEGYEVRKSSVKGLPPMTKLIFAILILLIGPLIFFNKDIYNDEAQYLTIILRRGVYLLQPLIVLSLYPFVDSGKSNKFIGLIVWLSIIMVGFLFLTRYLPDTFISKYLNNFTAHISSILLYVTGERLIEVNGNFFSNKNFFIEVQYGCSSIPDMILAINSVLIFYLCCKLNSKIKLVFVLLFALLIAFLLNAFRIAVLAKLISKENPKLFEFWHIGLGSFLFSLFIMTTTSYMYYIIWNKENPK